MTRRILVVDDEPDIVFMMKVILRSARCDVIEAGTVREALDQLDRHQPDAVLLDIRLPDGEGWEILDHLRESGRLEASPVIMVSAHATPSTSARALQEGAAAYITKPFTAEELTRTLNEVAPARD